MAKKNHYFGEREEEAIKEFISDDVNPKRKNELYKNIIHPTFEKMIRMLIYQRGIHYTGQEKEGLISETQAHVWEALETSNFDPEEGKAYSYFTRTVLNYLYQKQISHQREKEKMGFFSIDDDENFYLETYIEEPEEFSIEDFLSWYKKWLDEHLDSFFENEDEMHLANAIYTILKNDDVDIEDKRDLNFAIFQMTGIDNNYKINKVLSILREKYFKVKNRYSEKREIDISREFK